MKKIVFQTDSVLPMLTQVAGVVVNKCPVAILETLLFQTEEVGGKLKLTGSDNETWVSVRCDLVECDAGLSFCLNAKDVLTTLRNLQGLVVTLEFDEASNCVNGSYSNGKFSLPFQDASAYPKPVVDASQSKSKTINADNLFCAIDAVRFAAANDTLRPVMNGVHFDFYDTHMAVAASDGVKLVKYVDENVKRAGAAGAVSKADKFTLAKKPASLVTSLLNGEKGDVRIAFTDFNVTFATDVFELTTRLMDMKYPNYDSVIWNKDAALCHARVNRDAVLGALRRVMPLGNASVELVKLQFAGSTLTVSSENYDFSTSAVEYIECEFTGEPLTIGFKGSTLSQVMQNVKDENVLMYLKDASAAARIEPSSQLVGFAYVSILMPMMLN